MENNRLGVVSCLDKDMLACFDEGVVACLDKNNKDDFDVCIRHSIDDCLGYLLLVSPLGYIIEGTSVGQFIVHHGYMNNDGLSHDH